MYIETLLEVIDRLIGLKEYQNRRFRILFKDTIEPTFNDLLIVHGDYIHMFKKTYELLPRELISPKDQGPEFWGEVEAAREYLAQKRTEFEPIRVKLRSLAKELSDTKLDTDVDDFVNALLFYFPTACVERGGSASVGLYQRIKYFHENELIGGDEVQGDDDPHLSILTFIPKLIENHRKNWSYVCEKYATLHVRASLSG